MTNTRIAAFARLAKENTPPVRTIGGQKTRLARDIHEIRYDAIHDEFFVTNSNAQAIMAFRGGASGEEAPIRVIQGPHTQLRGSGSGALLDRLEVDPIHNEIFINSDDSILVFPRDANGDVAPIRVIHGPDTKLHAVTEVVVDPVNNVLVAANGVDAFYSVGEGITALRFGQRPGDGGLVTFNRTDNGNVKPRTFIHGPKAGIVRVCQMQVYPPKGWVVITHPGKLDTLRPHDIYIGVWSINDDGDVPARWKLTGPKSTMIRPRGVVLDPAHKEIIVADMGLNAIMTYYFPEIF